MSSQVFNGIKAIKYGASGIFLGSLLYTRYIDNGPYSKLYESFIKVFPNYTFRTHKFLLSSGIFHPIQMDNLEPYLNGRLGNLYLPSIVGLAAGYEAEGNCIESLYKLGYGFIEIGSLNPQMNLDKQDVNLNQIKPKEGIVTYENDIINNSVLKAIAYVGSFRRNQSQEYQRYPLGSNVVPNTETRQLSPHLSETDMVQAAKDILQVSDYVVLNFQGPHWQNMNHILNEKTLKEMIDEIKNERIKQYALQSIFEQEDYEIQNENQGRIKYNKIYTSEIYGKPAINNRVQLPQIFLKLNDEIHSQQIQQFSKHYKDLGIEGLIIVNNKGTNPLNMLKKVSVSTKGNLPLISVGGINSTSDIIQRIKNGANAVQLCQNQILQGPNYIENLSNKLVEELQLNKIKNIKQIQSIDIQ